MRIAVEGCCHGELDKIYAHLAELERKNNYKVDLLLICGDFQAIRNNADLLCMAVPPKYRELGGFHRYYTGEKKAPLPTLVIGGNHEASNYMWELYHGGFLAPNIYYLGYTGCVRFNGLRIAGSSGIFKDNHYTMGHSEFLPYTDGSMRSIYHTRLYGVSKLLQLASTPPSTAAITVAADPSQSPTSPSPPKHAMEPVDVFLSHDWPQHIAYHGDTPWLLRTKPFFKKDVETGQLGSPPMMQLLKTVKPRKWFSAHLHVKFGATFDHNAPARSYGVPGGRVQKEMKQWGVKPPPPTQSQSADTAAAEPRAGQEHTPVSRVNPDEIQIDEDEDELTTATPLSNPPTTNAQPTVNTENPDEIQIDDEEFEPQAGGLPSKPVETEAPSVDPTTTISTIATPATTELPSVPPISDVPNNNSDSADLPSPDVRYTEFLALDKCLPNRGFLAVIDIPNSPSTPNPPTGLTFDPQWLAITRAFHPFLSLNRTQTGLPSPTEAHELVMKELKWIEENVGSSVRVEDVQKFGMSAPGPGSVGGGGRGRGRGRGGKGQFGQRYQDQKQPPAYLNPQTEAFCNLIGVENKINSDGLQIFAQLARADVPSDSEGSKKEKD